MDVNRICVRCFRERPYPQGVCPHCGMDERQIPRHPGALTPKSVLYGRYFVGMETSPRGPGERCYGGMDLQSGNRVWIRERMAPNGSRQYQFELMNSPTPGGTNHLQNGPGGTNHLQNGPGGTNHLQNGPGGTNHLQGGPGGTSQLQGRPGGTNQIQNRPGYGYAGGGRGIPPGQKDTGEDKKNIGKMIGIAVGAVLGALAVVGLAVTGVNSYVKHRMASGMPAAYTSSAHTPKNTPTPTPTPRAAEKRRAGETYTLMVYMVGSNLESCNGAATADLSEMLDNDIDYDANQILVYCGGAGAWYIDGASEKRNTVLKLNENGHYEDVGSTEEPANMGDPETFSDFLNYCYDNFPADHYALICWDHGNGPIGGFGNDELFGYDSLLLPELEEGLRNSPFGVNRKLDWLGFDACLMSTIEVADIVSDYADYMIASEEVESGDGWDYHFLSVLNDTTDPLAVLDEVITTFEDYYRGGTLGFINNEYTLAMLDLSQTPAVKNAVENLFGQMNTDLDRKYSDFIRVRDHVKRFGIAATGGLVNSMDIIDLGDLADLSEDLYKEEAGELRKAVDSMVLRQTSNVPLTSGITMYYPLDNMLNYILNADGLYEDISVSRAYTRYMKDFTETWLNDEPTIDWTIQTPKASKKEVTLELTKDQTENLSSATFNVLQEISPGVYTPVLTNFRVEPNRKNKLVMPMDLQLIYVENGNTRSNSVCPIEQMEINGAASTYKTCATRVYSGETAYYENSELMDAHVSYQVENDGSITIRGINRELDDGENQYNSGRDDIDLDVWPYLGFVRWEYEPAYEEESNKILPYYEWNNRGYSLSDPISIDLGFWLDQRGLTDVEGDFYCQFVMQDTLGYHYASDLVKLH